MLPCGLYNATYEKDTAIIRTKTQWGLTIFALAFFFTLPAYAPAVIVQLFNLIWIHIIAVLGLLFLTGLCGQISIGQAAFVGVGAYTTAFCADHFALPFWLCIPFSGLVAGVIGLIFGLPAFRLKGFYIAMATLAAQFILGWVFTHATPLTKGWWGYPVDYPTIAGIEISKGWPMYSFCLVTLIIMTYLAKNIARTKTGRAFIAIRDNDLAAEVQGININAYKLLAFFLCSFFAGVAGSVFAYYQGIATPEQFTIFQSIPFLGMLIIGGMNNVVGPFFGVAFIDAVDRVIKIYAPSLQQILPTAMGGSLYAALSLLIFGIIVIVFLIFEPRGLAHRWEIFKSTYRLRPFPY